MFPIKVARRKWVGHSSGLSTNAHMYSGRGHVTARLLTHLLSISEAAFSMTDTHLTLKALINC